MPMRLMMTALAVLIGSAAAHAAGCDLDDVVGYQLVTTRTIQGYIDFGQKQQMGFVGCIPGRILVFTDLTGLRCKGEGRAHLELPKAWVFAHGKTDIKLCIGDEFYEVGPVR